jgi:tetratricopeptide (TPR) repeat protein
MLAAGLGFPAVQAPASSEADRLYAAREDPAAAAQAAALWTGAMERNPQDFESAWKLSRAQYWIGGHTNPDGVRNAFEAGITAARKAIAIAPGRPEGHFWLAANMGALAETQGMRAGLRYRGSIRDELQRVLAMDPAFLQGSADRALGRWYYKVPGLFGGSKRKSEEHLRRALTFNPHSTISHFFLAETLEAMDRDREAREEYQRVIDAPLDPDWTPEDREFKAKARAALAR